MSFSALHCGQFLKRKRKSHCSRWPSSSSEPPLAAAAKVFNQGAVGGGFAPEGIGEAAGRAEDLHRHVVAFALRRPHFRGIQVMRIAGVVEDQTVGFPRRQAQTAANDLLVKDSPTRWGGGWRSGRRAGRRSRWSAPRRSPDSDTPAL